nr:MAG TPA: hypothetical protein [Caudoviricetes sp.]
MENINASADTIISTTWMVQSVSMQTFSPSSRKPFIGASIPKTE